MIVCDKCGQEKTAECDKPYCATCAKHTDHDATAAHCADCGGAGHASKAEASCPQYVAPAETCAFCGQPKTDACNAAYCTTCASHAGHEASAHCVDCGAVGHASKADSACSQYVAPASSETVTDSVSQVVSDTVTESVASSDISSSDEQADSSQE